MLGAAGGLRRRCTRGRGPWLLGVAVAAAIVVDVVPGLHLPGPRRQVNEEWLHRYRGWVYGAGFGLQLGLGVTTIVSTAAVYATAAAAALAGTAAAGAAVGAAFGAARAATLLAAGRVREPRALAALDRRLHAWERPARAGRPRGRGRARDRGGGPGARGMRLAAHGIALDLPAGWDGRVWSRPGGGPVLHAANVALPAERRRLRHRGDGGACRPTASWSSSSTTARPTPARRSTRPPAPTRVDPGELSPATLLHRRPGQRGLQRFFTASGRAMCLYVVVGSAAHAADLAAGVSGSCAPLQRRAAYW